MPTLILSSRQSEDSQRLWRAASRRGWRVERLTSWRIPDELRAAPEPVVYAEALFAPTLAAELGLTLVEPPDDWLPTVPDEYRRRSVRLMTAGAARANPAPTFVKPPNDKSFPAAVRTGPELPDYVDDAAPVLVQDVVSWEVEFRCFLLDRELRAFSAYLRDGELQKDAGYESTPDEDAAVRAFVARVTADKRVLLPRAVVMDVGVVRDRGWAVVELERRVGAGLYGCDPSAVLDVLRHAATRTTPA